MTITIIKLFFQILSLIVLVDVVLSYFLTPYHPFRNAMDRIVNPMLQPIRRIVPPVQGIDFSPVVLLILIQIIEYILLQVIR